MTLFPFACAEKLTSPSPVEVTAARGILELAVELAVRTVDWRGLERALGQLSPIYAAVKKEQNESVDCFDARTLIRGVELMHYLVVSFPCSDICTTVLRDSGICNHTASLYLLIPHMFPNHRYPYLYYYPLPPPLPTFTPLCRNPVLPIFMS